MKVKVSLWVGGKVFDEVVIVASYEDAKKTALARNPTAKVIAINPIFDQFSWMYPLLQINEPTLFYIRGC